MHYGEITLGGIIYTRAILYIPLILCIFCLHNLPIFRQKSVLKSWHTTLFDAGWNHVNTHKKRPQTYKISQPFSILGEHLPAVNYRVPQGLYIPQPGKKPNNLSGGSLETTPPERGQKKPVPDRKFRGQKKVRTIWKTSKIEPKGTQYEERNPLTRSEGIRLKEGP